jgi:hypothetical protein
MAIPAIAPVCWWSVVDLLGNADPQAATTLIAAVAAITFPRILIPLTDMLVPPCWC